MQRKNEVQEILGLNFAQFSPFFKNSFYRQIFIGDVKEMPRKND